MAHDGFQRFFEKLFIIIIIIIIYLDYVCEGELYSDDTLIALLVVMSYSISH